MAFHDVDYDVYVVLGNPDSVPLWHWEVWRHFESAIDPLIRAARGKPPYRRVPYIFIAPSRRGIIGETASEVFRARYSGRRGLRSPDFPLLNRLLGGDSPAHGELLSYLFFDRDFIDALIDLGRADATRWLNTSRGPEQPWQTKPLDAFIETGGTVDERF